MRGGKFRIDQVAVALLTVGLGIRLLIAALLPPGFDEAYYYLYTLHLDWSYFDHPLLVALTTGFGTWLSGDVSPLSIRLGSVGLYTGSLFLLYRTGCHLFSPQAGLLTLAIATAIPIFQAGFGILTLPDSPLIFFSTAALWMAVQEFFPTTDPGAYRPTFRLSLIGLMVGLACLGKYHGLALGGGLVLFCLSSGSHRRALYSGWTVLALGLFLLSISPIVIWNAHHEWISFRFQSSRAVEATGYRVGDFLLTGLVGVGYLFPSLGLPLWWAGVRGILGGWDLKRVLILWVSLPMILGFTAMGGYRQILPTWPMPGFWPLTLLLGQQASLWILAKPRVVKGWLIGSGLITTSLLLIALLHVRFGLVQKPGSPLGVLPIESDSSTQLIDIRQLRQGFADSPQLMQALNQASFVFTNHYFLGGQIGMALVPLRRIPLACFYEDMRGFAFWFHSEEHLGKDALYITSNYFAGDQDPQARYGDYFESLQPLAELPIRRAGEVGQTFKVYHAHRLRKPYPRPYG